MSDSTLNSKEASTSTHKVSQPNIIPASRPDPTRHIKRSAGNSIIVSPVQKGNPLLAFIKMVPWEYGDILGDYQVGLTTGVLYLSLRYHLLHPTYVHSRFQKLGQAYNLRILLVHCDATDHQGPIRELTKVKSNVLFSKMNIDTYGTALHSQQLYPNDVNQEAASIITLYKQLASTPPTSIKGPVSKDYMSNLTSVLTNARGINKTDVLSLSSAFGSLEGIVKASQSEEKLLECPGIGEKKAKRLKDLFEQPFQIGGKKKRPVEVAAEEGNELN